MSFRLKSLWNFSLINFLETFNVFIVENSNCNWLDVIMSTITEVAWIWRCTIYIDGVWIGELDLLNTCTHHSELQVITALSLISTLYKSQQHPLSLFQPTVFTSRSLATASNSGDCIAFRAHIVTVRRISRNWTLVDCQLNYSAVSSQLPLQSSPQLPALNWTPQPAWTPRYIAAAPTRQKTPLPRVPLLLSWAVV
jgi:hypothetical protein